MIATLMGWGLSSRIAKLVTYVGIPILILAVLGGGIWWLRHDAYGDGHKAGVEETDAKWVEAGERLKAEAAKSATRADDKAAVRLEQFEAQVEDERKALDEAQREGSSPLDVLFGD